MRNRWGTILLWFALGLAIMYALDFAWKLAGGGAK